MHSKNISHLLASLVVVALCLATLGCPGSSRQKQTNVLRIGVLKHESTLPIYVANDKGFFTKRGLRVELIDLPPGDHMPALLADRVDILSPTSFPVLFGVMQQNPNILYAVFPGAEIKDGPTVYGLVVTPTFRGHSIKDIKDGVIMAINPFTRVNIQMILSAAGIPRKQWPEIRVATRESALKAVDDGTAIAAIMDQPALAVALASKRYRLLEKNPRAKYVGSPYWSGAGAVKQQTWTSRRADFESMMAAVDEAIKFTRDNAEETKQVLASRLSLDKAIADQTGGYFYPYSTESVSKKGIADTVEALKETGLLKSALPITDLFPPGLYGEK